MRSSWKKLKEFMQNRSRNKAASTSDEPKRLLDEVTKSMQKVQEMRNFYEGFHKASSIVAVRAHAFSEAVQDMGKYLMTNFGPMDDGHVGNVLTIVGKVQLEIAGMLELYAIHVSSILTIPSENILHDVQVVEDLKRKHDEKRKFYDNLHLQVAKARSKNEKGEIHAEQQLQATKRAFDELALSVGCRALSLEQGRSHNILTNVSQHHTAQMHLYRRAFASLNKIEPYIDLVAQESKIDRQIYTEKHHVDSESESDQNADAVVPPSKYNYSTSPSSLEEIPVQEKMSDDESFSAWASYADNKPVLVSPVRLPEDEVAKDLLTINTVKDMKPSSQGTPQILEGNQTCTSGYPLNAQSMKIKLPHQPQSSFTEVPENPDMPQSFWEESFKTDVPANAPVEKPSSVGSHSSFLEKSIYLASQQMPANVSPALPPSLAQRISTSRVLGVPNITHDFQRSTSGISATFNKRHSLSGPLTPRFHHLPDNIWMPSSSLIPPLSNVHVEAYIKSGPLYPPAGPWVSPRTSPIISPPRISELYKLPLPPNSGPPDLNSQSGTILQPEVSPQVPAVSRSSPSYAAPLPPPPQSLDAHDTFSSLPAQRGRKNTAF